MKTVLITGANNGIGLETTKELLKNDYNVIAISKHINNLEEIKNSNLKFFSVNLTNPNEINDFFDKIIKEKQIDILINNAGRGIFKKSEDFSIEEWNSIISLNLTAPFYLTKLLLPEMKENKFGRIINIGSDADHIPEENASVYCASKYGLLGLTEAQRLELKKYNIQITTISPGRVDTCFNNKKKGDRPTALYDSDIARMILFILSQPDRCLIEQIKLSSIYE